MISCSTDINSFISFDQYDSNQDKYFDLDEFVVKKNKQLLKVDEYRKLQLIQNGKYSTYDPNKTIKVKVLVDSRVISYVEVKLGNKITFLMTLFDENNILFVRNGYIINPSRTFGNFGFRNEEKIEVIHFIPGTPVKLKSEIEWTKIYNLSDETRVRSIFQENLSSEMARINDIRTKKIKKQKVTKFRRVGGNNGEIRYRNTHKTVIPEPAVCIQCEPLPNLYDKEY